MGTIACQPIPFHLLQVQTCGIFLDRTGFLGASPDGLVGSDITVEIKCPISLRDISVEDHVRRHCSENETEKLVDKMPYLVGMMGSVRLNKNHAYYHQIQGQLHLTGYIKMIRDIVNLQSSPLNPFYNSGKNFLTKSRNFHQVLLFTIGLPLFAAAALADLQQL